MCELVNQNFAAFFRSGALFFAHRILVHQPVERLPENSDLVAAADDAGSRRVVTAPPGFRCRHHAHQRPADNALADEPRQQECDRASQSEQRDAVADGAVDRTECFAA